MTKKAQQQVLVLGFFLPADKPEAQKTPPVYRSHARPDQEITTGRLDSLFVAWDGKQLQVADPTSTIDPLQFDALHIVDWSINVELSYAVAHYLQAHNIPTSNPSILQANPETKLGEMIRLCQEDIPYPKSFYAGKSHKLVALYEWAHQTYGLQFPIIVKGTEAAQGDDNFMARSMEELQNLPVRPTVRYIMQECIPNQFDYRVLVIGGRVTAIIKRSRTNAESHLNNISQGALAELISIEASPEIRDVALRAAKAMGRLDHAGVDILANSDTGALYVLEVNRRPDMAGGQPEIIAHKLSALYDYIATL